MIDKLIKELPEASPAAGVKETTARAPSIRADVLKTTIYIPVTVHDRLREIAFAERRKVHDLLMEGIDRVIENRGHAERTADRKAS